MKVSSGPDMTYQAYCDGWISLETYKLTTTTADRKIVCMLPVVLEVVAIHHGSSANVARHKLKSSFILVRLA